MMLFRFKKTLILKAASPKTKFLRREKHPQQASFDALGVSGAREAAPSPATQHSAGRHARLRWGSSTARVRLTQEEKLSAT